MKLHSASAAKEVAFLQSVVEQLSQEQKAQRATITDTIKRSMAMFDGRSRSQAELHVARQVMMEHFEEFEQEWLDLCHVMDQERFQVAALKKYQQAFEERQARRLIVDSRASRIPKDAHRAGAIGNVLILRSEAHLRRKFARARWTRAALRCNIRDTEHRLRAMDARLRTICSAVGGDDAVIYELRPDIRIAGRHRQHRHGHRTDAGGRGHQLRQLRADERTAPAEGRAGGHR